MQTLLLQVAVGPLCTFTTGPIVTVVAAYSEQDSRGMPRAGDPNPLVLLCIGLAVLNILVDSCVYGFVSERLKCNRQCIEKYEHIKA